MVSYDVVLLWFLVVIAVLLAWAAWARARRLARKLDALNQSYWELRYDFTRLRSQVARLDPAEPERAESPAPAAAAPTIAFVPLSSIKRKE
jgi:hypothetical protein